MSIKGKLLSGTIALTLITTLASADADSLKEKRDQATQLQNQITQTQEQVQKDKSQEQVYQAQVDSYTASLNTVNSSLAVNQQQYEAILSKVQALEEKIRKNQISLQEAQTELANQLRYTYENGNSGYLDVLFQAQSFSDFVSQVDEMSLLAQHQHDTITKVKALKSELVTQQKSLLGDKKTLETRRAQLVQLQSIDNSLKLAKTTALNHVREREHLDSSHQYTLESQLKETQAQIQEIIAETQAAEKQVSDPGYVAQTESGFTNVNVNSLIHYAEQFIGLPYVWGGTTPNPGFDCSGYTQYVYTHFGVPLNRTSEEQFAQGISVSRSNLQPGDLVFFSTYAPGATHVGIYIGNGMMINSEDAGLIITSMNISYWASRYIGARRVMNEQ